MSTDMQALFTRATRFLVDPDSSDDAVAIGLICDLSTALTHALRDSRVHLPTLEAAARVADDWSAGAAKAIRALAKRES